MARTTTFNYLADGPPETTPASTWFAWADNDDDPFSREQDLYYLALALERHDHRAGRGLSVGRIDAGSIDVAALGPNSVTAAAIADGAVGTNELADNAVTSAKILNGTIQADDLDPDAVTDSLGYTPVNKAGDTELGSMSWGKVGPPATSATLTLLNASNIAMGTGTITGAGSIAIARTTNGIVADFRTTRGSYPAVLAYNTDADNTGFGYSFAALNKAATGYDFIVTHADAQFGGTLAGSTPIRVFGQRFHSYITNTGGTVGVPPFTADSSVMCTNLNANFLNGQTGPWYGRATHEVIPGMHAYFLTETMPPGWTRSESGIGRVIVASGKAVGPTVVDPGITFLPSGQAGTNWYVQHTLSGHTHSATAAHSHSLTGSGNIQYTASGQALDSPAGSTNTGIPSFDYTNNLPWNYPTFSLVLAYKDG